MATTRIAPGGDWLRHVAHWCFPSWQVDVALLVAHLFAHLAGLPLSAHVLVALAAHSVASAVLDVHGPDRNVVSR